MEGRRQQLAEALERKRDGQPLHLRLRHIQGKIDAKEKSVVRHKEKLIPDVEKAMEKLHEKLKQHRAKLDEEEKELQDVCAKRDLAMREDRSQPVDGVKDPKDPAELAAFCTERVLELRAALNHPFCQGGSSEWCRQATDSLVAAFTTHLPSPLLA